jgi:hypothetical protein
MGGGGPGGIEIAKEGRAGAGIADSDASDHRLR